MRNQLKFSVVLLIVGFMIAIQYNTIQKPEVRDTRDMWAIRKELANEKKMHSELLAEIRALDETIRTYESLDHENTENALRDTVEKLHEQAGMTDTEGPGLIIEVEPAPESIAIGSQVMHVSPELLTQFVNELNRVKWKALEIDGKRYTTLSAIRDINGFTTVNGLNVSSPPIVIKVVTDTFEDSERVYNTLKASAIHDDFYLDDLILKVGKPSYSVKTQGWKERVKDLYLKELPKGE